MNEDVFSIISEYLDNDFLPVSHKYYKNHIDHVNTKLNKNKNNGIIRCDMLVDIMIHAPGFCHKYCICKAADIGAKRNYYSKYRKKRKK